MGKVFPFWLLYIYKVLTMKICQIQSAISAVGSSGKFSSLKDKAVKYFSGADSFGEGTNITMDFLGKALVVPALILMSPSKKSTQDEKFFVAAKNPVGATIQLAMEVPILIGVSKWVEDLAQKGILDGGKKDFSYNTKAAKEEFVKAASAVFEKDSVLGYEMKPFMEKLEKKGLTKKLLFEFSDILEKLPQDAKMSLDNLKFAQRRLYHLQNRIAFAGAILMAPVIGILESKVHTKIMNYMADKKKNGGNKNGI
jgi:hypothetical protein